MVCISGFDSQLCHITTRWSQVSFFFFFLPSWVSFSIGSFGSNIIIVPNLQNFDGQGYRYKQHIFGLGMMLIAYIFKLYGLGFKFSLPLSNIPMLAILLPILPLISWSCSTAIFQFRPHLLRIRALALKIISLS